MSLYEGGLYTKGLKNIIDNLQGDKAYNIAAFDLDCTIIKTKSGKIFPTDNDDWEILYPSVYEKLKELSIDSSNIFVIFTNKSSTSFNSEQFTIKMNNIEKKLNLKFITLGATEHNKYRKPCTGMWVELMSYLDHKHIEINKEKSFYVGDAAGRNYKNSREKRKDDFSNTDYTFALNLGIKFYVPEEYFLNEKYTFAIPPHPKRHIDNMFLSTETKENIEKFDHIFNENVSQEMIILVGPPACGKTQISKKFKNYVVISQDILKNKKKVFKVLRESLEKKHSVVIDRKNEYINSRKELIDIAKEYKVPVKIIWIDIEKELCEHLNMYRTLTTDKRVPTIVFNKYFSIKGKGFEIPTENEGTDLTIFKIPLIFNEELVNEKIFNMFLLYFKIN